MELTVTITQEQWEALQNGNSITIEPPKPKNKWIPGGGNWKVDGEGDVIFDDFPYEEDLDFGTYFASEEQAEKARDAMRKHNRLLAYVAEHYDEFEKSGINKAENGKAHYVYFCSMQKKWLTGRGRGSYGIIPGMVFMPSAIAEELAEKLNNGEVEL